MLGTTIERPVSNQFAPSAQTSRRTTSNLVKGKDVYQELNSVPGTTISIQYTPDEVLTFNVSQVERGQTVKSGIEVIGLYCRINGITYTFGSKHLNLMSHRERTDLFNHLTQQTINRVRKSTR